MKEIEWEGEYTMQKFVSKFSSELPILVKTLTGYAGCDQMHEISSDEVYVIYKVERQKKIVFKVKNKETYLSIPCEYDEYFEYKNPPPNQSKNFKLKQLDLNKLDKFDKVWMRLLDNTEMAFQVGADDGGKGKFGFMKIVDTYDEKYLLGYPICDSQVHSNSYSLPVYVDIELQVAVGFKNFPKSIFDRWHSSLIEIVKGYTPPIINMCTVPLLFTELPEEGDYEYINPRFLSSASEKVIDSLKANNEYVVNPTILDFARPAPAAKIKSTLLPPLPRRPLPSVPLEDFPEQYEILSASDIELISQSKNQKDYSHKKPEIHNKSLKISNADIQSIQSRLKSPTSPTGSKPQIPNQSIEELPRKGLPDSLPTKPLSPLFGTKPYAEQLAKLSVDAAPCYQSFDTFQSIHEIPVNYDLSRLTIGQVGRLLRLLNFNKYEEEMRKNDVDGQLLIEMTEEMLVKDFSFSSFDARKLVKFVLQGWRPSL